MCWKRGKEAIGISARREDRAPSTRGRIGKRGQRRAWQDLDETDLTKHLVETCSRIVETVLEHCRIGEEVGHDGAEGIQRFALQTIEQSQ